MSITKRSFLVICCMMTLILLTLDVVTYRLLRSSMTEQLLLRQEAHMENNRTLSRGFTQALGQMMYQYAGDEELGTLLNASAGEDALKDAQIRQRLNERVAYHLNAQTTLLMNSFTTSLYLNPALGISSLFGADATVPNVSRVFSGELVAGEPWYQEAAEKGRCIFADAQTEQLCFAYRLQSTPYPGPFQRNGQGVLLTAVSLRQLPVLLAFTPITKGSGFLLLDGADTVVYSSENLKSYLEPEATLQWRHGNLLRLGNHRFLYSQERLDWGMRLVFLTPYEDLNEQIGEIMAPYLLCSLVFLALGALSALVLAMNISRPIVLLTDRVEAVRDTRTVTPADFQISGPAEVSQLGSSFVGLIDRVNVLIDQVQKTEADRRESELRALQAQTNPHFVLNAMNAVNYMALARGEDDIANTVDSIAHLMRYSITEPYQMVTLESELAYIREYIGIYVLRFRSGVQLQVDADRPEQEFILPKFTLQPLVENSIRHGVLRRGDPIQVRIQARREGDLGIIDVTDTGVGADAELLNAYLRHEGVELKVTHGFGIRNVNERLSLRFGQAGGLRYLYGEDGRLVARLTIPQNEKNAPDRKETPLCAGAYSVYSNGQGSNGSARAAEPTAPQGGSPQIPNN